MKVDGYFVNTELGEQTKAKIASLITDNEQIKFIVNCDLTTAATYGDSPFIVTDKRVLSLEIATGNAICNEKIEDVESASVKRMYGNAEIRLKMKDGRTVTAIRFTYALSMLCDMAANYITNVANGEDETTEYEAVEATYDKLLCVCPKCGRKLIRPGAECINCASKKKLWEKFLVYIKPETKNLIISLFLQLFSTCLALLPPYITQMLVDDILPNEKTKTLWIVVSILAASYIFGVTTNMIRAYLLRASGARMVETLRDDVYRAAQYLPMNFYDKTSTGSVINRISNDCGTINAFVLRITQEVISQFFMLIGIIVIMLVMNIRLSILALIPVPLIVIFARRFGKKIAPYYRRIWRKWARVTSLLTDTLPGIRVVKAFAGEKRATEKFDELNHEWLKTDIASAKITTTFPQIISFLVCLGSLLIWSVGGNWVIHGVGGISVGLLVSFLSYASMFYTPVNFFANFSDTYQNALASIERVLDVLDAEPEASADGHETLDHVEGKIEFRNVSFSFDKTKKVLSDINLVIEPGDIVGVVGTTGSGKTTLINLLLRFYDNYDGEILLDGHNIRDLDINFYRSKIGYVQQEAMLFRDTVFNNIAYSKPDSTPLEVIHAADVANAHGFIVRQPDAYDTMLGERGIGLSGGEKQRISIARAVLKEPSLMIFDEATASVDSETENLIQEAIERLITGKTTIMIAHRLSTLRKANKIIVVDQGKIIENGTHEELMALQGKYYRLVEIQNLSEKIREKQKDINLE